MPKPKKNNEPKHQLTPLKVKGVQKPVKKGDIPTVLVEGDYPSQYNEAKAVFDQAEGLMKELRPVMEPDALAELFRHNSERPWDMLKSVKLQDEKGEVTRITLVSKYSPVNAQIAQVLFDTLKTKAGAPANINEYLARTMVGKFDSKIFLDPDGKFNQKRYDVVMKYMGLIAAELGFDPLSTEEVVLPLPDYDSRRWVDFDLATNKQLSEVIKGQVNFVPCPNATEEQSGK